MSISDGRSFASSQRSSMPSCLSRCSSALEEAPAEYWAADGASFRGPPSHGRVLVEGRARLSSALSSFLFKSITPSHQPPKNSTLDQRTNLA